MEPIRLVTVVDVDDQLADTVTASARHEVELADGRRVLLLDDRGWASSARWPATSVADVEEMARMVVGPDEPFDGRTRDDMATDHWAHLRQNAQRQGLQVDAAELRRLPHDVVLSERVLARVAGAGR